MKLLLTVAALSSAVAAEKLAAAGLLVDCVAFQDAAAPDSSESTFSTLRMGQCLMAGDAICSSTGSWAFGIDPTDRMIKLWEGGRVSRVKCTCTRIFDAVRRDSIYVNLRLVERGPSIHPPIGRLVTYINVHHSQSYLTSHLSRLVA